ncbi:MAG: hypothetical protein ACJ768_11955 [Gaiellaceae bacterium]
MKKLIPAVLLTAAAIVVPAQASKPADPGSQGKGHSHTTTHTNSKCKHSALSKSYVFGGTLTAAPTLTQTAGQGTTTTSDDRYTANLSLTVTNANKYAKGDHPKGSTYSASFTDVKASFGQNADNTPRTPQAGDHVSIHGRKVFKVKHNCTADPNKPVGSTTYTSVHFGDQPATP